MEILNLMICIEFNVDLSAEGVGFFGWRLLFCLVFGFFYFISISLLLHMLEFTAGAVALSNIEFAFFLRTSFLAFFIRTICKEIAKEDS